MNLNDKLGRRCDLFKVAEAIDEPDDFGTVCGGCGQTPPGCTCGDYEQNAPVCFAEMPDPASFVDMNSLVNAIAEITLRTPLAKIHGGIQ